ncbi:hypothetical protein K435DRAFT_791142 [Dendrothele bispora CBS 962.96]|uniref:Uncharacterized protein n=1 Tax=Dendrothele bispora (strain CBS 962.96) TaxID=1314807 RepID=A0A4S8MMX2_DENBC|nr:hypothetical protein K435DRAFT_791142 [Dendrothele bispora CBS 962.96]
MSNPIADASNGGGIAGLAVVNHLLENGDKQVLVLEAGPNANNLPEVFVPGLIGAGEALTTLNWAYTTVPQTHLNGRVLTINAGKLLGRSTAINRMIFNPRAERRNKTLGNPQRLLMDLGTADAVAWTSRDAIVEGEGLEDRGEIPKPRSNNGSDHRTVFIPVFTPLLGYGKGTKSRPFVRSGSRNKWRKIRIDGLLRWIEEQESWCCRGFETTMSWKEAVLRFQFGEPPYSLHRVSSLYSVASARIEESNQSHEYMLLRDLAQDIRGDIIAMGEGCQMRTLWQVLEKI